MREIMFRGRRTYDGKWAYGHYVDYSASMIIGRNGDRNIVDPETVGQYTGMLDRDGYRIFEGDIIGGYDTLSCIGYLNGSYCGTNTWTNKNIQYVVEFTPSRLQLISAYAHKFKIIGNIHEVNIQAENGDV